MHNSASQQGPNIMIQTNNNNKIIENNNSFDINNNNDNMTNELSSEQSNIILPLTRKSRTSLFPDSVIFQIIVLFLRLFF
jgi:hypothetical protein